LALYILGVCSVLFSRQLVLKQVNKVGEI